jgi:hypothetical protein
LPAFPKERYSAFIRSLGQGALSYVDAPVWQGFLGDENVPEDETHGTVYVRMPASLKRQFEAAAESDRWVDAVEKVGNERSEAHV